MIVKGLEKIVMMRSWLLTYSVMILAVIAALLVTRLLLPVFDPSVFTLFYAAVAISAWYGGMRLGVLAIALSVTFALYFLIEPVYSFDFLSLNVLVRLTSFSVVSFLITALSSELRTARRKAEISLKLLQNSEMRFSRLAESNIIGVIVTDMNNGSIIEANDAFLKMVGYTREDFSANQMNWREITPHEYILLSERSVQELRTTGVCKPFEKEYICKNGDRIPVLIGSVVVGDTQETVIGFVVDLSERKQAQAALQQANERNTRTLENMSDAFITLDRDWRIIYQNAEAERINRKSRTEVIGKSHWEECPLSVGTNVELQYRRAMAEQIPVHFEHHYYLPSKYDLWLEIHASPCEDGLDIFFRDISQRKQAEKAVEASEERLKSFVKANIVGILFGDVNGSITEANDEFLRIVGYTQADIQAGRLRWTDITPPEYQYLDELAIAEATARGTCTPYEKECIRKDGSSVPVVVGYSLLGESQQNSVAFILDISDLQQAKKYDEATTTRALETIERNAKLQTQLIEDLLDVSRILQGKLSLNIAPVNLETAIASAIETVRLAAQAKSINLRFTILDFGLENPNINLESIDFKKQPDNLKSQIQVALPAIALTAYAAEADYQQAIAAGFGQHITKPVEPAKLVRAIANLICSCSNR